MSSGVDLHIGEGAWPDLVGKPVIHLGNGTLWRLNMLPHGMSSGAPSVAIRLDLPAGGATVIAEVSLRALVNALHIMLARSVADPEYGL